MTKLEELRAQYRAHWKVIVEDAQCAKNLSDSLEEIYVLLRDKENEYGETKSQAAKEKVEFYKSEIQYTMNEIQRKHVVHKLNVETERKLQEEIYLCLGRKQATLASVIEDARVIRKDPTMKRVMTASPALFTREDYHSWFYKMKNTILSTLGKLHIMSLENSRIGVLARKRIKMLDLSMYDDMLNQLIKRTPPPDTYVLSRRTPGHDDPAMHYYLEYFDSFQAWLRESNEFTLDDLC